MNNSSISPPEDWETSWTLIRAAGEGSEHAMGEFAKRYEPLIRRCLQYRWRSSTKSAWIDDAIQEVFIECIRPGGVLAKADDKFSGGFRSFLRGVVRNIILRFECRPAETNLHSPEDIEAETSLSQVFDREFAKTVMNEASLLQRKLAADRGEPSLKRVQLLEARFQEGLPIRQIAENWGVKSDWLHHEYARARHEFEEALMQVVASHQPASTDAEVRQYCRELLTML